MSKLISDEYANLPYRLGYSYIGTIVPIKGRRRIVITCDKGHQYETLPGKVRLGRGCPECSGRKKLSIDMANKYAESMGGKCLSDTYIDADHRLSWECGDGHRWTQKLKGPNSKVGNSWCPVCNTARTSEQTIRDTLKSILKVDFIKVRPSFLKNPETGCNLELDGYCEELKLAFEYDGKQHYKERSNKQLTEQQIKRHGNLEYIQANDRLKDKLCRINGITLIRISYKVKNIEKYIEEQLKLKGIKAVKNE